jgi:hypothetical protein
VADEADAELWLRLFIRGKENPANVAGFYIISILSTVSGN